MFKSAIANFFGDPAEKKITKEALFVAAIEEVEQLHIWWHIHFHILPHYASLSARYYLLKEETNCWNKKYRSIEDKSIGNFDTKNRADTNDTSIPIGTSKLDWLLSKQLPIWLSFWTEEVCHSIWNDIWRKFYSWILIIYIFA